MISISIVLPSYNRSASLIQTLESLAAQTSSHVDYEVIVVDDGSTDNTLISLEDFTPPYSLSVHKQQNQGAGASRNQGARQSQGELLIFLDADIIPYHGLVQAYWQAYQANPIALYIGRILPWDPAYQTLFDQASGIEKFHDLGLNIVKPLFYHLASGNFAVSRQNFLVLGGFDEQLRMTEDTDLGYRTWLSGIPLEYCPDAIGYHNHPKTFAQRCQQTKSSAYWTAHLIQKHLEIASMLPIYQDVLPVKWQHPDMQLAICRIGRYFLALKLVRLLMEYVVRWLEKNQPHPKVLNFFYWKILGAYRLNGLREGLKTLGYSSRSSAWSIKNPSV